MAQQDLQVSKELIQSIVDELVKQLDTGLGRIPEPEPEYVPIAEVARRTSFSYDFVYDAVKSGDLPGAKQKGEWRVALSDMRAWMNKSRVSPKSATTRRDLKEETKRLLPGL